MRQIDIKNWKTTSELLSQPPLNPADSLPFNTSIGRNAERKNAGYEPARQPITTTSTSNVGINQMSVCALITNSLPDIWLNSGSSSLAPKTAITVAIKVTITDSDKNCAIKYLRGEPSTLRTPTSRALFDERAVDRFMKFTQAMSNINMAMAEKMYTI